LKNSTNQILNQWGGIFSLVICFAIH